MQEPLRNKTALVGGWRRVVRWTALLVCALALGFSVGLGVMAAFDLAYALIGLVWMEGTRAFNSSVYVIAVPVVVGIVLSAITARYGKPVKLRESMASNRANRASDDSLAADSAAGSALTPEGATDRSLAPGSDNGNSPDDAVSAPEKPRPLWVRVADFLVPFAGGGPVGVAMGTVGLTASGCMWVAKHVRELGVRLRIIELDAKYTRVQKYSMCAMGIAGGVAGSAVIINLFGLGMVLPRVGATEVTLPALGFAAVLSVLGWLLGIAYLACAKAARFLWDKAARLQNILPIACGIALGASMVFLPHAGLPGSDACSAMLIGEWTAVPPIILIATALVRTVLIGFLLNWGWSGGPFLPLVYSALCLGLGVGSALGIDASACAAAAMTGIIVSFTGKPLLGIAALMCCPLECLPYIVVALIVTAIIPRPKSLKTDF